MKSKLFPNLECLIWAAVLLFLSAGSAAAAIDGITGPTFNLTAKVDFIQAGDGGSIVFWGYADTSSNPAALPQYPGPTLIVNQNDVVQVTLTNALSVAGAGPVPNVSIVFPGQNVTVDWLAAFQRKVS